MKKLPIGVGGSSSTGKALPGGPTLVPAKQNGPVVAVEAEVHEVKAAFAERPKHEAVPGGATREGHVVPINSRQKNDPLLGAAEVRDVKSARVADVFPAPARPRGYRPREIWQGVIELGQGHDYARSLIGRQDLVEKLKDIGFDASVAAEWRDFYHSIDQFGEQRERPNPSAKGRAEFIDWVVVQLGGTSAGLWKGAAA